MMRRALAVGGVVVLMGCSGSGSFQAAVVPQVGEDRTGGWADPCALKTGPALGGSPLRALTRAEYNFTIQDLLGDTSRPADSFPPDAELKGFTNNAHVQSVSPLHVERHMLAAEQVAARVALASILPCTPATAAEEASCAQRFIESFGPRAYRRPLAAEDVSRLRGVYDAARAKGWDFSSGVRLVMRAILQSPNFLYRVELGTGEEVAPGVYRLTDHELATRLSYFLWGSAPGPGLQETANRGELRTPAQVLAMAQRMVEDARTRRTVQLFHQDWLLLRQLEGLEKDPAVYPTFSADLLPLFAQETKAFIEHVVFEGGGELGELLSAPYTFMNGRLAQFYGAPGVTGTSLTRVDRDPSKTAGLLTQAAFLATQAHVNHTAPVLRGKFVREQLLCTEPPPPPPGVETSFPATDPTATMRERLAQHREDPTCASCHAIMDPIGLSFENFDGVGLWRDEEGGRAVDASGEVVASDIEGPYVGVPALAQKLSGSRQVASCVATQWFRFAQGRTEAAADACGLGRVTERFTAQGRSVKALLVELTQTDAFLYRTGANP